MRKISYRLTALSNVIVSPRANLAFYRDLDDFSEEDISKDLEKRDKIKIIYPFYQYGTYDTYDPAGAAYYLPGSSIKGALRQEKEPSVALMVDDIPVSNDQIVLQNICKAQYLDDKKKSKLDVFFNHVGVEMLIKGTELKGQMTEYTLDSAKEILEKATAATRVKLEQMCKYLSRFQKEKIWEEKFNAVTMELSKLSKRQYLLFLGGYKGLLLSMQALPPESQGAVFIDPSATLPYGLVEVTLL